jgi:hypothetical protein
MWEFDKRVAAALKLERMRLLSRIPGKPELTRIFTVST